MGADSGTHDPTPQQGTTEAASGRSPGATSPAVGDGPEARSIDGAVSTDGGASVTPTVRAAAAWSWRVVAITAGAFVVVSVVAYFKVIVIPVAVALLLTVLLQPVSGFLRRRLRFSSALAAATSVLLLIAAVVGLVALAGGAVVAGMSDLSDKAVLGMQQLLDWLSTGPLNLDISSLDTYLDTAIETLEKNSSTLLSGALSVTTSVGQFLAGTVIALFCTLFFLMDGRRIWAWVVGLLPRGARERTHQAGRRGLVTLASYARTQILVAFIDGVGIGIGAAIIGVPLAMPLGVLVFVGSFIPFVGAILTGSIAVLVALVANGWVAALVMLGVVLLVQQIEGNVLQPWLMGHAVSLHPVAVLLVVTGGTLVAGIVGALFAVPLVAVVNTVVLYFHGHDKFPELGLDDHVDLRPAAAGPVMVVRAERTAADLLGDPGTAGAAVPEQPAPRGDES